MAKSKNPYNWAGASKINWFPGTQGMAPGSLGTSILGSLPTGPVWPTAQTPGGGGNPASGILADYLSKMRADTNAASVFDAASRDAALRRLVISYGQVPDFSALGIDKNTSDILRKAIDANTIAQAQKNTEQGTSAYARMLHANQEANRAIPAQLAGRGLLRSGQTTHDLTEQAQGYKNQQFDALNEILGNANQAIGAYAAAERARQEQLAQMELQAALAAAQEGYGANQGYPDMSQFQYPTGPAGGAPPPPATQWHGFFGTIPQTKVALRNRQRAGRM